MARTRAEPFPQRAISPCDPAPMRRAATGTARFRSAAGSGSSHDLQFPVQLGTSGEPQGQQRQPPLPENGVRMLDLLTAS